MKKLIYILLLAIVLSFAYHMLQQESLQEGADEYLEAEQSELLLDEEGDNLLLEEETSELDPEAQVHSDEEVEQKAEDIADALEDTANEADERLKEENSYYQNEENSINPESQQDVFYDREELSEEASSILDRYQNYQSKRGEMALGDEIDRAEEEIDQEIRDFEDPEYLDYEEL